MEGMAAKCSACAEPIIESAQQLQGHDLQWHPECFVCADCKCGLEDGIQIKDGKLFCLKDFAIMSGDLCDACNDPITDAKLTALGQTWHATCFGCFQCSKPLAGESFCEQDGNPFCREDYGQLFSPRCTGCRKAIIEGSVLNVQGEQYHEDCFVCEECETSLQGGFMVNNSLNYCAECHTDLFTDKCAGCGFPCTAGSLLAMQKTWHKECFNCTVCLESLNNANGTVNYFEKDGQPYCQKDFDKLTLGDQKAKKRFTQMADAVLTDISKEEIDMLASFAEEDEDEDDWDDEEEDDEDEEAEENGEDEDGDGDEDKAEAMQEKEIKAIPGFMNEITAGKTLKPVDSSEITADRSMERAKLLNQLDVGATLKHVDSDLKMKLASDSSMERAKLLNELGGIKTDDTEQAPLPPPRPSSLGLSKTPKAKSIAKTPRVSVAARLSVSIACKYMGPVGQCEQVHRYPDGFCHLHRAIARQAVEQNVSTEAMQTAVRKDIKLQQGVTSAVTSSPVILPKKSGRKSNRKSTADMIGSQMAMMEPVGEMEAGKRKATKGKKKKKKKKKEKKKDLLGCAVGSCLSQAIDICVKQADEQAKATASGVVGKAVVHGMGGMSGRFHSRSHGASNAAPVKKLMSSLLKGGTSTDEPNIDDTPACAELEPLVTELPKRAFRQRKQLKLKGKIDSGDGKTELVSFDFEDHAAQVWVFAVTIAVTLLTCVSFFSAPSASAQSAASMASPRQTF
jgi:hypothetical protein